MSKKKIIDNEGCSTDYLEISNNKCSTPTHNSSVIDSYNDIVAEHDRLLAALHKTEETIAKTKGRVDKHVKMVTEFINGVRNKWLLIDHIGIDYISKVPSKVQCRVYKDNYSKWTMESSIQPVKDYFYCTGVETPDDIISNYGMITLVGILVYNYGKYANNVDGSPTVRIGSRLKFYSKAIMRTENGSYVIGKDNDYIRPVITVIDDSEELKAIKSFFTSQLGPIIGLTNLDSSMK